MTPIFVWLMVIQAQQWNSRGHFFGAAAEAMRRILVDNARENSRSSKAANSSRQDANLDQLARSEVSNDIVAIDEALAKLAQENAGQSPSLWN